MSDAQGQSLLDFLDAPVLVGDPESNVVFANKAFVRDLCSGDASPHGEPLASLFAGGGRESVLAAVAEVCSTGKSVRFRLREAGRGYLAVASPIQHEESRVGVIIQLTDEPSMDARLLDFHREIQEPLDETGACLDELLEATGGRRHERFRELVERGSTALVRARKWSAELHGLLCGGNARSRGETLAPGRVLRQVEARLAPDVLRARCELALLIDPKVGDARGDGTLLETALVRLIRQRLMEAEEGRTIGLLARNVHAEPGPGVLVSVVDSGPRRAQHDDEPEPVECTRMVREIVKTLGGEIVTLCEAPAGWVTSIWLPGTLG